MTRAELTMRRLALWGSPTLAVLLLAYLFWDELWADVDRARNLALVAAAAVGLPIAVWRSYIAYRQAETAHRQAETAHDSLLAERYQRAAEMLGGKEDVRLAGIHALARMAQQNLPYHVLIMSTLSAVARTSAKRTLFEGKRQAPEDVTVIMEVLAERSAEQLAEESAEVYRLDLRATDLRGLLIDKIKLSRAILDYAVLSDADNRAVFWDADFQEASLIGAGLAVALFSRTNFAAADLSYANLSDAQMAGTNFREAVLTSANCSNAKLNEADITRAVLYETDLSNVTGLTQQQLNSAQIDPARPPTLDGSVDPDTGEPLVVPA